MLVHPIGSSSSDFPIWRSIAQRSFLVHASSFELDYIGGCRVVAFLDLFKPPLSVNSCKTKPHHRKPLLDALGSAATSSASRLLRASPIARFHDAERFFKSFQHLSSLPPNTNMKPGLPLGSLKKCLWCFSRVCVARMAHLRAALSTLHSRSSVSTLSCPFHIDS